MMTVDQMMKDLVRSGELPGGVLVVRRESETVLHQAYGSYKTPSGACVNVTSDTQFDVASLTKVVATLPALLLLETQGKLAIHQPIADFLPEFKYPEVSIEDALRHQTGLPADLPFVTRDDNRDIVMEVIRHPLVYPTGEQMIYSDLGMILLGEVVKEASGMRLDHFCHEHLFHPLHMSDTTFNPLYSHQIASTEWKDGQPIQGEVHDEKAWLLGGVSGSAGLFSTAKDLARYADMWQGIHSHPMISNEALLSARANVKWGRGLGFEVQQSNTEHFWGKEWPDGTFGHTGFTGTSLCIDPHQQLSIILLTNVVHFGRDHKLRELRKTIHTHIRNEYS